MDIKDTILGWMKELVDSGHQPVNASRLVALRVKEEGLEEEAWNY